MDEKAEQVRNMLAIRMRFADTGSLEARRALADEMMDALAQVGALAEDVGWPVPDPPPDPLSVPSSGENT